MDRTVECKEMGRKCTWTAYSLKRRAEGSGLKREEGRDWIATMGSHVVRGRLRKRGLSRLQEGEIFQAKEVV